MIVAGVDVVDAHQDVGEEARTLQRTLSRRGGQFERLLAGREQLRDELAIVGNDLGVGDVGRDDIEECGRVNRDLLRIGAVIGEFVAVKGLRRLHGANVLRALAGLAVFQNDDPFAHVIDEIGFRSERPVGMGETRQFDVGNGVRDVHDVADNAPDRLGFALGVGKCGGGGSDDDTYEKQKPERAAHWRYSGVT